MIGKISSGQKFQKAIDYISAIKRQDKKATLLMHSNGVLCTDNRTMAACLEAYSKKGHHNLSSPLKHISLSFHPDDAPIMTDRLMARIAKDYMIRMGFIKTEYVVFRHHDTEHPHCHIVLSRVDNDGNVISDSHERQRNIEVCRLLTQKYGLKMGKKRLRDNRMEDKTGNRQAGTDKIHEADRRRLEFRDKVMQARDCSADWGDFYVRLSRMGIRLMFRYNNVSRNLMGVTFKEGKQSYSGKKLDSTLTLSALTERFGDLPTIAHENVRDFYEDERERLLERNEGDWESIENIEKAFPDFDSIYPNGASGKGGRFPTHIIKELEAEQEKYGEGDFALSKDGRSCFVSLANLLMLLTGPYIHQLEAGGGGGPSNDRGWRDDEDEWWKRWDRYERNLSKNRKPRQRSQPRHMERPRGRKM